MPRAPPHRPPPSRRSPACVPASSHPPPASDDDADGGCLVFAQVTVSQGMDELRTLEKRFSEVRARRGERRLPCRLCMVLIASR